jgi:hypothetical protein
MIRLSILVLGALLAYGCASDSTSTKGQMVSCSVKAGVVSDCHPFDSKTDKLGAPGTCQDADDEDTNDDVAGDDDKDSDGVPDEDDCDDVGDGSGSDD